MPVRLTEPVDFARRSSRGGSIDDFSAYADGQPWRFERGPDFTVQPRSVARRAKVWAEAKGLDVDTKVTPVDTRTGVAGSVILRFTSR